MLGIDREWPEVFDAMVELLSDRKRKEKRDSLAEMVRQRAGKSG